MGVGVNDRRFLDGPGYLQVDGVVRNVSLSVHEPGFRYPRAPIAEALLDVRVEPVGEDDLLALGRFSDDLYPQRVESVLMGAEVETGPLGVATRAIRKMNGFRFVSADGLQIVQLRTDGFTFSRLAPYEEWEIFFAEARRLWCAYVDLAPPHRISRMSLRYINQVLMPEGAVQIDDYLRTRPEISDDMPTVTTGYFLTMEVPIDQYGCVAQVIQTMLPPDDEVPNTRLVLDIDAYRLVDLALTMGKDSLSVFDSVFSDLRNAKNLVFEASITDTARGQFQ